MTAALLALLLVADHTVTELACPEVIDYRVARDLDGDGLDELLVISGKEVWVWNGRAGPIQAAPDRKLALGDGAAMFDVFGGELVVRYPGGYRAVHPKARVLPFASGPGLPSRCANILWRGFFRDLDLDGRSDFIDVSLAGYTIHFAAGDTLTLPPRFTEEARTGAEATSERLVERYALGGWTDGNFDGDLRPDFAVITGTGLLVYTGDAKGRFDPERRLEIKIEEAADADLSFHDFNNDGQTDLLAVRRKAGRATVLVGDARRGLTAPHRIRLALPGEMRYPIVTDFDGDRRPDLALPYIPKFGFEDALRVVTRGEVIVKVPIFLNRGGRDCIPRRADAQQAIPIKVRVRADESGRIQLSGLVIVEYEGDLDGDGRLDLVVTEKPDVLAVRRGVPTTVFHEEVDTRMEIPDCSPYDSVKSVAADLNGDKLSDIILHYRGAGQRPDRLFALVSRKK